MRCVIVLGGDVGAYDYLPQAGDFVIACDSGYDKSLTLGIVPQYLIGDMDSISSFPEGLETSSFSVRKDDTDCMLAIKEGFCRGYTDFVFLCGFGGKRTDHLFANLQSMLYIVKMGGKVEMCGEKEWCCIVHNETRILPFKEGYSLSVFAVGGLAKGVTLKGVSYPLENHSLEPFFPLGVSNFITQETGFVSVEEGYLLVFCSPMDWH